MKKISVLFAGFLLATSVAHASDYTYDCTGSLNGVNIAVGSSTFMLGLHSRDNESEAESDTKLAVAGEYAVFVNNNTTGPDTGFGLSFFEVWINGPKFDTTQPHPLTSSSYFSAGAKTFGLNFTSPDGTVSTNISCTLRNAATGVPQK